MYLSSTLHLLVSVYLFPRPVSLFVPYLQLHRFPRMPMLESNCFHLCDILASQVLPVVVMLVCNH